MMDSISLDIILKVDSILSHHVEPLEREDVVYPNILI